jgi:primosomal protein N' (replication factor Y)
VSELFPGFDVAAPATNYKRPVGRIVRVQPDITSIRRSFDYVVPASWERDGRSELVVVGALVRVDFGGRRTAGWVTEVDVEFDDSVDVRPLVKWSSYGPPQSVIDLAEWAAWRWSGRLPHFLRAASPPRMVTTIRPSAPSATHAAVPALVSAFDAPFTVVRTVPHDDAVGLATAACALGSALILVPTIAQRRSLVRSLRDVGIDIAEYDEQWERSAAGASTVGTRRAAFAPMANVDAVLVVDEHDGAYKEERTPAWNARDVAVERARRTGAPCVLASPTPSLEALHLSDRQLAPERSAERNAWPRVDVVDMRDQDRPGLLTDRIVDLVRGDGAGNDGAVACILNRKGRARMLACATCGSLAACTECGGALREDADGRLECARDAIVRPMVCSECSGTHMKQLRLGITRLAEDLAVLAKRPVFEVSAETPQADLRGKKLFIGTEALLHRLESAHAVVFLDFDQELSIPRVRAAEEAFALLALAARRVGPRDSGGRVIVQTRRPDDVVVQAALRGDPGLVATSQRDIRQVFDQPPYGAWAMISGAGAETFASSIDTPSVQIHRLGDRWRLSAVDHETLLGAVNAVERPAERVRVEIDPLDV